MHVDFKVVTMENYFHQIGREIDWEGNDNTKVPYKQAELIQKILAIEASIYLLRRATGLCGCLTDTMVGIRSQYIKEYNEKYEEYISFNDFY